MLRGFATRIEQHLLDSLQVFEASTEKLVEFVKEDEVKSRRRELVESAVKRQREGINKLDEFMRECNLKSAKTTRNLNQIPDTCIGLPDVSGIFSSGRSLGSLLEGSRLHSILSNSTNQAQAMALDRKSQQKKEKEKKKESKHKKEEKEKRDDRKRREKKEKEEREKREKAEKERAKALEKEKQKDVTTEKTTATEVRDAKDDVTAEFERIKIKLLEAKAQERKNAAMSNGVSTTDATIPTSGTPSPPGSTPGPKAWIRPQIRPREDGTEDEAAKRTRFGTT